MNGIRVDITGAGALEVADVLKARLAELGAEADVEGGSLHACVVVAGGGAETLPVELDGHDTPDFAAEKIIDTLAEKGVVAIDGATYTAEDEEQIRRRLQDLGYIE